MDLHIVELEGEKHKVLVRFILRDAKSTFHRNNKIFISHKSALGSAISPFIVNKMGCAFLSITSMECLLFYVHINNIVEYSVLNVHILFFCHLCLGPQCAIVVVFCRRLFYSSSMRTCLHRNPFLEIIY